MIAFLILFSTAFKSSALTLNTARWHRTEGGRESEGRNGGRLSIYKLLILTHRFLSSFPSSLSFITQAAPLTEELLTSDCSEGVDEFSSDRISDKFHIVFLEIVNATLQTSLNVRSDA